MSGKVRGNNQLRILDYRNGKYQGEALQKSFTKNGIGMLLDHNYLLAIAKWQDNQISGPTLLLYPDNTILTGTIHNQQMSNLCTYQVSQDLILYYIPNPTRSDLFVLDNTKSSMLHCLKIGQNVMDKLKYGNVVDQKFLIQYQGKNKNQFGVEGEKAYQSFDEKWNFIEKFLGVVVEMQKRDYKDFVKHHFRNQVKREFVKLNIVQTRQQFQFGFKNSTILTKITQKPSKPNTFSIKFKGYYSSDEQYMQICRKEKPQNKTQQSIIGKSIIYENDTRPLQCRKNLHQYYKQSIYYVDAFLEVEYLYKIKFICNCVADYINLWVKSRFAQVLLENEGQSRSKIQEDSSDISRIRDINNKSRITAISQLSQKEVKEKKSMINIIKEEVYRAVSNKKASYSPTPVESSSTVKQNIPQYSRIIKQNYAKVTPNKSRITRQLKYQASPIRNYDKRRKTQNMVNQKSSQKLNTTGRHSFVYLQSQTKNPDQRRTPSKYSYLVDHQKQRNLRQSSFNDLTDYYQLLDKQIHQKTPKKTKRIFQDGKNSTYQTSNSRVSPDYMIKNGGSKMKYKYL